MGLDQYLYASRHLPCYPHNGPEAKAKARIVCDAMNLPFSDDTSSLYARVQIGYWRKANQIHGWLILNCADNDPEKTHFDVSRESLKTLLALCREVQSIAILAPGKVSCGYTFENWVQTPIFKDGMTVTNAADIAALLPPTPGFFFGSYEIDQWYMADIDHTIAILEAALALDEDLDFEYMASW